jgi:hypothetical protein
VLAVMDILLPEQAETLPEGSFFALPGGAYGDGEIAAEFEDGDLEIPAAPPQEFTEMVAMEVLDGMQPRTCPASFKRELSGFDISTCNDHYDDHYARSLCNHIHGFTFLFQLLVFFPLSVSPLSMVAFMYTRASLSGAAHFPARSYRARHQGG